MGQQESCYEQEKFENLIEELKVVAFYCALVALIADVCWFMDATSPPNLRDSREVPCHPSEPSISSLGSSAQP